MAVLWLGCAGILRALTICSQCAHEQPEGANFCTHCGARLAADGAQAGAEAPPAAAKSSAEALDRTVLVSEAVREDVLRGREYVAEGRPDVARAVLGNALALAAVEPTALTLAQGEQLLAEIRLCEQNLALTSVPCPACEGSGKRTLRFSQLTRDAETTLATGQTCPTCRGTGKVRRSRSISDLKFVLGQARQQAEQALRARGRIPVGNAWVPPELPALLEDAAEARLRHAAAAPCPVCQGLGRTDCARCGNTGTMPCTARGCDQGWVVREELNRLDARTEIRRREPCAACQGTARVQCPHCQGSGTLTCRSCNGTGKRPACPACGGDGTAKCRACRGEGRKRDGTPCAECGGDGIVLCASCRGDGYRSR